jgi:hypothetical protein
MGYFAKMASVDDFVFLDNCQLSVGRSYASRVQVRGREGAEWMSVSVKRHEGQRICDVKFADRIWIRKHQGKLQANYGRCPFFPSVMEWLRPIYADPGEYLATFNMRLIREMANYLGLSPRLHLESEMGGEHVGTQRLVDIVLSLGGTTYVSGAGGAKYQDPDTFSANGITLDVRRYQPAEYRQTQGEFVPGLSVLDALFHLGPDARALLGYTKTGSAQAGAITALAPLEHEPV